jgi:hypothetical protein
MLSHISFQVDYDKETHDGKRFLVADVKLFVNGAPLFPDFVLDAIEVLVQGTHEGRFYPVTCGCGVPECAGIHDDIRIHCDATVVAWLMPRQTYGKRLQSDIPLESGNYVLRFERRGYEEALVGLRADLERKRHAEGCPLALLPDISPEDCLTEQRLDKLDEYRAAFLTSQPTN